MSRRGLDEPTRDGDVEIGLITNLPNAVTAKAVADTSPSKV
jgi:hypothetical protein